MVVIDMLWRLAGLLVLLGLVLATLALGVLSLPYAAARRWWPRAPRWMLPRRWRPVVKNPYRRHRRVA